VRGRLITVSLLAGILISAGGGLAAGSGTIGIRLIDVTAHAGDNPLARVYIVDRLAPGTTIHRRVEISNTTGSVADVQVYPGAATLRHGRFAFAPGHTQNELSSWTSVSRDVLRLPAGTKAFETVTIRVPRQASSGEHSAVIWAQVSSPPPTAGGVTLVNRVGIRMYISIGPDGAHPSNFAIGAPTAKRTTTGAPLVVAEVHNSGRRTLEISGSLTLSNGPGGLGAGPFPVKLGPALAPGASEPATVRLDTRLPRGPWRVHIRLRSGVTQRAVAATITFPRAVPPPGSRHLIPVAAGLLVLLMGAAFALVLVKRRRRGRRPAVTLGH
jgi:hypothetical protein